MQSALSPDLGFGCFPGVGGWSTRERQPQRRGPCFGVEPPRADVRSREHCNLAPSRLGAFGDGVSQEAGVMLGETSGVLPLALMNCLFLNIGFISNS